MCHIEKRVKTVESEVCDKNIQSAQGWAQLQFTIPGKGSAYLLWNKKSLKLKLQTRCNRFRVATL